MKYKNEKTGAVIDVSSNISGGNWKPLVENDAEDKKKAPGRKRPYPSGGTARKKIWDV